jgi:ATP phosphoribosyltransferase
LFTLPQRDLVVYAARGGLHLAVCGSLAVDEASTATRELLDLGPTGHELALFGAHPDITRPADVAGRRVATPFPHLVRRHLAATGIAAREVIALDPVDHAGELGIAEAVAAVVDRAAPLPRPYRDLCRLATVTLCRLVVIAGTARLDGPEHHARDQLLDQLDAARLAQRVQLVQFDCPTTAVSRAVRDLPARRGPELGVPSHDGWTTVRALLDRKDTAAAVAHLLACGCRDVLTFDPVTHHPGTHHPGAAGVGAADPGAAEVDTADAGPAGPETADPRPAAPPAAAPAVASLPGPRHARRPYVTPGSPR